MENMKKIVVKMKKFIVRMEKFAVKMEEILYVPGRFGAATFEAVSCGLLPGHKERALRCWFRFEM